MQTKPDDISQENVQQQKDDAGDNKSFLKKIKQDFTEGYVVIGATAFAIILVFLGYGMMQSPPLIMGQGLAFDNVSVDRDGHDLTVNATIVNAMDSDRGIPSIKVTKILAHDIEGDTHIIKPEKEKLHSGESIPVSIMLKDVGSEVLNLTLAFNLAQDKIAEKSHSQDHEGH